MPENVDNIPPLVEAVRCLTTAMANASLYAPDHPQVRRLCQSAQTALATAIGTAPELGLLIIDEEVVAEGRPLPESLQGRRFAQILQARGIGQIKVLPGVSAAELQALILDLSRAGQDIRSTPNLRLGRAEVRYSAAEDSPGEGGNEPLSLQDIAAEEIACFGEIYAGAKAGQPLRTGRLHQIVTGFVHAFQQESDPLLALAPLRAMDEYTFTHSSNVCILNMAQAMALGISGPLLHDIGMAAMLHDVGKLFVPEEVLNKPGRLDDSDWVFIRQHPLKGAQYLLESSGIPRLAVVTAFEHHMRYDGSGYPEVPAGWRQNLCSQMTTLSDVYDAMRTKRPYSDPMPVSAVADRLRELAGKDLNPLLCGNFLQVLERLK